MKHNISYYFRHPGVTYRTLRGLISDQYAIEQQWKSCMGYPLNLDNPQTFNEKLQWLKLYDHNPLYTTLVDKYRVKQWVADKIGMQYIIPTLAVYGSSSDIDLEKLPDSFVLKCNHDSGSVCICKDKKLFDFNGACLKLDEALRHNYFYAGREWPYKNVKPLIFAEPYMEDKITHDLPDYKFFTFNGKVKFMFIATERNNQNTETKFDFFDENFTHLNIKNGHPNADTPPTRPECYDEMVRLAEILSQGIPHVRVDFYQINNKVYFGEMTMYHWSGLVPFNPPSYDYKFGEYIKLPHVKHIYRLW